MRMNCGLKNQYIILCGHALCRLLSRLTAQTHKPPPRPSHIHPTHCKLLAINLIGLNAKASRAMKTPHHPYTYRHTRPPHSHTPHIHTPLPERHPYSLQAAGDSSDWSKQSFSPSHTQYGEMQNPPSHENSSGEHWKSDDYKNVRDFENFMVIGTMSK